MHGDGVWRAMVAARAAAGSAVAGRRRAVVRRRGLRRGRFCSGSDDGFVRDGWRTAAAAVAAW